MPPTACRMGSKLEGGFLHWLSTNEKSRIYVGLLFAALLLTGWLWRPSIFPNFSSNRLAIRHGSGIKLSENVCWREEPSIWHGNVGIVEILGDGCGECVVGRTCRFQLHFHHPTPFKLIGHTTSHPDLMITVTGPTVFHATAREVVGDEWDGGIRFDATYTSWDAGNYTAVAESGCARGSEETDYHPLATWNLQVKEPSSHLPPLSACHLGQLGRWIPNDAPQGGGNLPAPDPSPSQPQLNNFELARMSDWKLGFYECAGVEGKGAEFEKLPGALLELGIKEMSFIGDSHMRALVLSLVYGIMAVQDPEYQLELSWHTNRVWDLPVMKKNETLRINYYWLGGLYEEEGQYGCTRWGLESGWPVSYSNSSDVVVMGGGAWHFQGCDEPRAALSRNLPHFLETIMAIEHKKETIFVWRSVPPYPLPSMKCEINPTRSTDLVWANDLFRTVGDAFHVHFLDFWALEAPRYMETCHFRDGKGVLTQDHHYLCMLHGWAKVWGDVGMDTTRYFLESVRRTAKLEKEKNR